MKMKSTGIQRCFGGIAAAAIVATAAGCAAPAAAEEKGATESHEEIGGGGGGGGGAIFLPADQQSIVYVQGDGSDANVIVCANATDPGLLAQIRDSGATPSVVIAKPDGTYDARLTDRPIYTQDTLACPSGGPAYLFQLRDQNVDFISQDLSAAFVSGFTGEHIECDGGFQLSRGLDIDVEGFRVENGVMHQPDITLRLEGDSDGAVTAHCSLKASSGRLLFQAGAVPVFYELEVAIGLTVSLSKSSHVSATIGTKGGSLTTDDPEIKITPEVTMGVTFYGVVGAYVGVGFPITVTRQPYPCSPNIKLQAEVKVGAQVGLLGIGDLPIYKALSVEVSSPLLGPWDIAKSQCN